MRNVVEVETTRVSWSTACKGVDRNGRVYIVVGLGQSATDAAYFALDMERATLTRRLLDSALRDPAPHWEKSGGS